jgi:magnesium-transporting ATPase (P-type)
LTAVVDVMATPTAAAAVTPTGLTQGEAEELRVLHGPNEIPRVVQPAWKMVLKQFVGPMAFAIEAAVVLAAVVASWTDFGMILLMLVANAAVGFHEERKSTAAMRELADRLAPTVSVNRGGEFVQLSVAELVPGDVIFLRGGSKVPADCHWLRGDALVLDNAALTGETRPVRRPAAGGTVAALRAGASADDEQRFTVREESGDVHDELYADQLALLPGADATAGVAISIGSRVSQVGCLAGGTVVQGEAYCKVDRTGTHTEMGRASGGGSPPGKGEFQRKIERAAGIYIGVSLIFVVILLVHSTQARGDKSAKARCPCF